MEKKQATSQELMRVLPLTTVVVSLFHGRSYREKLALLLLDIANEEHDCTQTCSLYQQSEAAILL